MCGYKYGRLSSAYLFSFQAHDGAGAGGIIAKQVRTHGTLCKFAGVRYVKYQRGTKVTNSNAIYQVNRVGIFDVACDWQSGEPRDSQPGASVDTYTYSTEWADVDRSVPVWPSVLLLIVACSAN